MVRRMNFLEPLTRNMRINLRRRDIRMTKEQLHHAQIGTMVDQVGRERVPQGMR
jgi:hypothetical protein